MPFKVSIRNFQAIRSGSFEVKGLTVLTGSSDTGKSACIRAIHGALNNRSGDSFVTQGMTNSEVTLSFSPVVRDGEEISPKMDLVWRKGGKYNDFEINNIKANKVGRSGVPQEVEAAGFKSVQLKDGKLQPQFYRQMSRYFIIGFDPSVSYQVFASLLGENTPKVTAALDKVRSDMKFKTDTIRVREADVVKTQKEISLYQGIDELREQYLQVKSNLLTVQEHYDYVRELQALESQFKDLSSQEFPEVSQVESISEYGALISSISSNRQMLQSLYALQKREYPVYNEPEEVPEVSSLRQLQFLLLSYKTLVETSSSLDIEMEQQRQDQEDLKLQISTLENKLGVCPLCERRF